MGSFARSSSRRASSPSPRSEADNGVSTKPAAIRLTRTGASSSASAAVNGGNAAVAAETSPSSRLIFRPPVPPMKIRVPPGLILPAALRATSSPSTTWSPRALPHLLCIHLEQWHVARAGAGDHHVIDRIRQVLEESLQRGRIGRVEGGRAPRADFLRCALEPLGIAAGEHDVGPLSAGAAGCFETDPGAPADEDDGLPEQFRFALGGGTGVRRSRVRPAGCRPDRSRRGGPSARRRRSPRRWGRAGSCRATPRAARGRESPASPAAATRRPRGRARRRRSTAHRR